MKGTILTALSGIVATREDILNLIREMDKRFETMQPQMDKFNAQQKQIDERFNILIHKIERFRRRAHGRGKCILVLRLTYILLSRGGKLVDLISVWQVFRPEIDIGTLCDGVIKRLE